MGWIQLKRVCENKVAHEEDYDDGWDPFTKISAEEVGD